MKPLANFPKVTLTYTLMVFVLVVYGMVRVINLSEAVQKVKSTADTTSYLRISKESIFDDRFLAGSRPLLFPLLLKLFRGDAERVVWAQGMFSIFSWSVLAVSVAYSLHTSVLRLAAFGLILLLSLYRYIIGWDSVLLTESLSLSLMALFVSAWLWLARGWRWKTAALLIVVAFLWAFCRDTNAWVVFMIAFFLLFLVGLRFIDRRFLAVAIAFMIMFFLSNLSADIGGRWVFPFQNVLGRRILPNVQAIDFFTSCGMPISPALLQLTGEFANGLDRAFYEDPALADYRLWLDQHGKSCYMKWLLSEPLESIRGPLVEFNSLVSLEKVQPFLFSRSFSPVLPGRLEAVLYPGQHLLIVYAAALGIVLIAVLTKAWTQNKNWWLLIGMIGLVFPHYFITWHGDIMGIFRHVVGVSLQFYLGIWLLIFFVLDRVFSFRRIPERMMNKLFVRSVKP